MTTFPTGIPAQCDVLVVGSGAGGMLAANRAADLGLDAIVIEKADLYGGTSALSGGGIWIPCNRDIKQNDTPEQALAYLQACTKEHVPEARLRAYVDAAPRMMDYLHEEVAVPCRSAPAYADYMQDLPGASLGGRTMFPRLLDAKDLGEEFFRLRQPLSAGRLFGRINISIEQGGILAAREKGWRRLFLKLLADYWLDLPWRRKTRRDRRLGMGNALAGGLRLGLKRRGVPLLLGTRLVRFVVEDGRVAGAVVSRDGNEYRIMARAGVVAAAGGFEQNQKLREQFLPVPTRANWSVTPAHQNYGDAHLAGAGIGAGIAMTQYAWWCPTVRIPARNTPNVDIRAGLFSERCLPHSICVNRLGDRFANEAMSYHEFGFRMMEDNGKTSANLPCWMIFDAQYRAKSQIGGILPSPVMPDSSLPVEWWDRVLYRAASVAELARKTGIPEDRLAATIGRFNGFARTGVDEDFERGKSAYDSVYCDKKHKPNPTLGALSQGPFYAISVDLGDIGTMGGLLADEHARVIGEDGAPIAGLYAIGNCASPVTGGAYPGAGATLGAALTFGFVAANHIASTHVR
ncbi:MAG: FAD-dependent oxidoreductase [Novosphingobium sp.]|nr:FAD-dependent oxidoreductase [Novosphingobium sp.]